MMNAESKLPDIAQILGQVLQSMNPALQPFLLAALERLAAKRYRKWASEHSDAQVQAGLLACADREEEIARRVESLAADASSIQDKLLSEHPEIYDLNRTLFEGRSLNDQFTIQAQGERAGAGAWRAYAAAATDPRVQEVFSSCSPLEEANAEFLANIAFGAIDNT
jgi:hypothetical protein